jgi:hypothetical protein
MQITREWLDLISDDQGLTNGQKKLLAIWCKSEPYVDKLIPDNVAHFLEHCRGYRRIPQHVLDFKGWPRYKMDVPAPKVYDHAIHKGPDHA